MVRTMICFLDFDGVLHPDALDQPRTIGATPTAGLDPYAKGHVSREDDQPGANLTNDLSDPLPGRSPRALRVRRDRVYSRFSLRSICTRAAHLR